MAEHATSTTAPGARPATVWRIRGLMDFAVGSIIAVEREESLDALLDINDHLWGRLADAPIEGPNDARGKLDAVLNDLIDRRDIGHLNARIVREVIDWLDGVQLS